MQETTQLDPAEEYRAARNIREKRRVQASALMPGLLLLTFGLWALLGVLDGQPPALWHMAALLAVGFGLALLARFLIYERAEPGLAFLGAAIALAAAASLGAWYFLPAYTLTTLWPLGLAVIGAALLLTLALSAQRDRRLLLPGLVFVAAGVVALPFTLGLVPPELVDGGAVYWPLLFSVVGLAALTNVLRRRA